MDDDLDECWQDLRASPQTNLPDRQDPAADLLEDWREVRNIPKFFYSVVRGFGPDYMAVRRVRCMGLTSRSPRMGGPSYRGVVDKTLYQGCKYTDRTEEGKQYAYSIKNCDLTLEAAKARFHEYLQEHLAQERANILRWEESVAELQRDINRAKLQRDFWSIFSLTLEESDA
jgi:hypothetical protein